MALVFRTDQTTPLTNDQLDGNFSYLRDEILLKYSISDFTAAKISEKLRIPGVGQTTLALAEANEINAWTIRDLAPSSTLPSSTNKASIVSRTYTGDITVQTVYGDLNGNASTATLAADAVKLQTPRTINGVSFDGSANITIADSTKLSLNGGTMGGKITLVTPNTYTASLNFGAAVNSPVYPVDGDMWGTSSGLFYKVSNNVYKVASIESPTFTGLVQAPGYTGTSDQVITISHLEARTTLLNTSIALKSNIASPIFTGVPRAPTATTSDNSTQIATTAFVTNAVSSSGSDITSQYQTYTTNAIVAHNNANNVSFALKADLVSPTFTGVPRAPTATSTDNSTQIATTAFAVSAASTVQQNLNAAVLALNNAIASTRPVPVGAVFYMVRPTVPYGYFEANGQAVSRTTYSDLWNYLGQPNSGNGSTTFNVPDLRGEFIRGWDNGRGVDNGRQLFSYQEGSNLAHNHGSAGDDQLSFGAGTVGWPGTSRGSFAYDAKSDYSSAGQIWNTTTDGGNEARPRNISLMPVIKW